jgi:hypothetical protein
VRVRAWGLAFFIGDYNFFTGFGRLYHSDSSISRGMTLVVSV